MRLCSARRCVFAHLPPSLSLSPFTHVCTQHQMTGGAPPGRRRRTRSRATRGRRASCCVCGEGGRESFVSVGLVRVAPQSFLPPATTPSLSPPAARSHPQPPSRRQLGRIRTPNSPPSPSHLAHPRPATARAARIAAHASTPPNATCTAMGASPTRALRGRGGGVGATRRWWEWSLPRAAQVTTARRGGRVVGGRDVSMAVRVCVRVRVCACVARGATIERGGACESLQSH